MVLSYDFIVWTHYIEQMNKLIERINWSAGAYWGEPNRMRFRTNIDSYTDATEVTDRERIIRTEFSVSLKGYLIPEAYNELAGPHTQMTHLTPNRVMVGTETSANVSTTMEQITGMTDLESAVAAAGSSPAPSVTLSNSFTLSSGTGITITNDGIGFDGSSDLSHIISIPQEVGTTSNVQFNAVTSSALLLGSNTISSTGVDGNWSVTGSVGISGTLTVDGDTTIGGTLTAKEFHTTYTSASIIYQSGSTKFGDTIDDTHERTGSMTLSGSFSLNGYQVTEISNDTSLGDQSTTAVVTEYAVKQYGASLTTDQSYLRKQFHKTAASIISNNTASFTAVTASAPATLTATSENDFIFFINGQYMEHDALTVAQSGSQFLLQVDTGSIGYSLEGDDEILSSGKFNS